MGIKKSIVLLLVAGFFMAVLPSTVSAARTRGIVAVWAGTFTTNTPPLGGGTCAASGCVGDLVTCTAIQGINITKVTFSYLEGVCDDLSSVAAEQCGGEFTQLEEECGGAGTPSQTTVGGLIMGHVTGETRTCFDPTGGGDCTGATPGGSVVAAAVTRTQTSFITGSGRLDVASEANGDAGSVASFTFNGHNRKLRFAKKTTFSSATAADVSCGTPVLPDCGIAGSTFSSK